MVYGVGVDIVNIPRFRKALERWGERFLERIFTERELGYCFSKKVPERHLAVRFAAKEAVLKALRHSLRFRDIEVLNHKNGRPCLRVEGLDDTYRINLSLSHDGEYGIAQVVVEERDEAR